MNSVQIAVVNQSASITVSELTEAVAAVQKQVNRDVAPIWNINASLSIFHDVKTVPVGYWPIFIVDNINQPGAAGYHTDQNHQPYSMVQYSPSWSLTLSHETIEMLVDPYGSRLQTADSIKPGQGRVQYLVEACDPCEGEDYAYSINGIMVSDFYTPHYFDPVAASGTRYSFVGKVTKPLEVLPGGYLSWFEPVSNTWWQATFFGQAPQFNPLNGMENMQGSLRSRVDQLTRVPQLVTGITNKDMLNFYNEKLSHNRAASEALALKMFSAINKK